MAKYFIDADNGNDSVTVGSNSAATPWKTLSGGWLAKVFNAALHTGQDEVVVSGLLREPNGVVINFLQYANVANRYVRIRPWSFDLDGPVGTPGTQVEHANNVRAFRVTGAVALTGTIAGGGASPLVISATNLGTTIAATNALGAITFAYYKNVDRLGRHYGFFKKATAAPGANGTQEYHYLATGATTSTITLDATNLPAVPSIGDFEYTLDAIGGLIVFQNAVGQGPDGPALLEGAIMDRVLLRTGGAYLASMENCDRAVFRNLVGYDSGHHTWGITGSGNRECTLDNCDALGNWGSGLDTAFAGGEGGNSMTSSGVVLQTSDLTYTTDGTTHTLTGTLSQQTPLVGTVIEVVSGTNAVPGQLVTVTAALAANSFTVSPALTGVTSGTANMRIRYRNMCVGNLVRDFFYRAYTPLGLNLVNGIAQPVFVKTIYGLSNVLTGAALNIDAPASGNRYVRGEVVADYDCLRNAGVSASLAVNAANIANGWASDLWNPDTYPLIFEEVTFDGFQQLSSAALRDVAFKRCSIRFAPSIFSEAYGSGGPQLFLQNRNGNFSDNRDAIARLLFESCEVIGDLSGAGAGQGGLVGGAFDTSALQTVGWSYDHANKRLTGGTIANAAIPRPGMQIVIYGGTGFVSTEVATVQSATASEVILTAQLTANAGITTTVTWEICVAELRAQNTTFIACGGRSGAATPNPASMHVVSMARSGVPPLNRGVRVFLQNCALGYDRTANAATMRIFSSDTNQAAGGTRRCTGNVYVNHTAGRISDATGRTTDLAFLDRATGADTTGQAEFGNVWMRAAVGSEIFPSSHAATRPPATVGNRPLGINNRANSGPPGAWQFGARKGARNGRLRERSRG